MKSSRSALSTAGLAVFATLGVLLPRTAVARSTAPTWVQGAAFSTGSRVPTVTVTLARPVAQGDLLVGWFSQYDAPQRVRVSDSGTGGSPGSVTPGSSQGVPYTLRAETSSGSSYEADITSSAAGGQHGTATLASATNWFAVCAVFHPRPATPPHSPSTPTGLEATSVASTRAALSWSPSYGIVAVYSV